LKTKLIGKTSRKQKGAVFRTGFKETQLLTQELKNPPQMFCKEKEP